LKLKKAFRKSVLIVTAMALLPCWSVPLYADDSTDDTTSFDSSINYYDWLDKPLTQLVASYVESRIIYRVVLKSAGPVANAVSKTIAKAAFIDKAGFVVDAAEEVRLVTLPGKLTIGLMINQLVDMPADELSLGFGEINDKLDKRYESYFNDLWKTFLNDPKLLGPGKYDHTLSYVREVFNSAADTVNIGLQRNNLKCCVNGSDIFFSEYPDAGYKIINGKAAFYIPAYDFAFDNVVEKVAADLAAQVLLVTQKSKVRDVSQEYNDDGSPRHWYSTRDAMTLYDASKIYAARVLEYPTPEFSREIVEKQTQEAFKKYKIGASKRVLELLPIPGTPEYDKATLSFRKQKITTHSGPETGEEILTRCAVDYKTGMTGFGLPVCSSREERNSGLKNGKQCAIDIQEDLVGYDLPECKTINLPKLTLVQVHKIAGQLKEEETRANKERHFHGEFTKVQIGAFTMAAAEALIAERLAVAATAGKLKKLGFGLMKLLLPVGAFEGGQLGAGKLIEETSYDDTKKDTDSDLLKAIYALQNQTYLDKTLPQDSSEIPIRGEELYNDFETLMSKADPRVIKIMNQLVSEASSTQP